MGSSYQAQEVDRHAEAPVSFLGNFTSCQSKGGPSFIASRKTSLKLTMPD